RLRTRLQTVARTYARAASGSCSDPAFLISLANASCAMSSGSSAPRRTASRTISGYRSRNKPLTSTAPACGGAVRRSETSAMPHKTLGRVKGCPSHLRLAQRGLSDGKAGRGLAGGDEVRLGYVRWPHAVRQCHLPQAQVAARPAGRVGVRDHLSAARQPDAHLRDVTVRIAECLDVRDATSRGADIAEGNGHPADRGPARRIEW